MSDDRVRAADPTTPPDELAALAGDHALAGIVATNPNTPWETLSALAAKYPRQILDNPVLPLLLVADPNLAADMNADSILALLRFSDIPLSFLYSAANDRDPRVHGTARAHVALAGEAGDDWMDRAQHAIFHSGSLRGSFFRSRIGGCFQAAGFVPHWLLSACAQCSGEGNETIRALAALSPDLSRAEFDALLNDVAPIVWNSAMRNPIAPPEVLYHLAHSQYSQIRLAVARNPSAPADVLKVLARDAREDVRSALASHPRLSPDLCRELARDGREKVLRALAANANTPADVLIALSKDEHVSVRCEVAEHQATPPVILKHVLMHDGDWRVRYAALQNPHMPADALQSLANEDEYRAKSEAASMRTLVARNPHTPLSLLWKMEKDARTFLMMLAKNPQAPAELLQRLAADPDANVRIAAAENPDLPQVMLKSMLDDPHMLVRSAVARHPRATYDMLATLAEDAVPYVCRAVARNPRAPSDIRVKAALQQANDANGELSFKFWMWLRSRPEMTAELSDTMLTRYAGRWNAYEPWLSKLTLLASPFCPLDLLETQSTAGDWTFRYAVARNPRATPEILLALADDGHRLVRAAARHALRERLVATLTGQMQAFADQLTQLAQGRLPAITVARG